MSDEIIKRVPSVIENPIIVMESKTVPGRITMFGELADADGDRRPADPGAAAEC